MSRVRHDPRKMEPAVAVAMEAVFRGYVSYGRPIPFAALMDAARRRDELGRMNDNEIDACIRQYAKMHGFNFGDEET